MIVIRMATTPSLKASSRVLVMVAVPARGREPDGSSAASALADRRKTLLPAPGTSNRSASPGSWPRPSCGLLDGAHGHDVHVVETPVGPVGHARALLETRHGRVRGEGGGEDVQRELLECFHLAPLATPAPCPLRAQRARELWTARGSTSLPVARLGFSEGRRCSFSRLARVPYRHCARGAKARRARRGSPRARRMIRSVRLTRGRAYREDLRMAGKKKTGGSKAAATSGRRPAG